MNLRVLMAVCFLAACLHSEAQVLTTETVATSGHPFGAIISPDDNYILCGEGLGGSGHAVLEVFHQQNGKFEHAATQVLPSNTVTGMALIPGTDLLALGMGNGGVGIVRLQDAERGDGKVEVTTVGNGDFAGLIAISRDGKYMFAGDEHGDGGTVRAFALKKDASGSIHPELLGKTPTPRANAGVAISPGGRYVYATAEVVPSDMASTLDGHGNPNLERHGCMGRPAANGALYTIDARTQAVLSKIDAGCSPTRVIVSADGKTVYMAARGDSRVLAFNAGALVKDPDSAFLRALPTGGTAPVGLALFDHDTRLLVANSNRFAHTAGSATVIDLQETGGKVLQTIPAGNFPRNVEASSDGRMLVVTVFGSNQLLILRMK